MQHWVGLTYTALSATKTGAYNIGQRCYNGPIVVIDARPPGGSIIAAYGDIPSMAVAVGVPARVTKYRNDRNPE